MPIAPLHLLIVRFSSLGDVILTTSLPMALKKLFGEKVFLTYLTSKAFSSLLEGHKDLDQIHTISRGRGVAGLLELKDQVKKIHQVRPIDLIVDLHGSLRSLFLRAFFWNIPRIFVDKRTIERELLTIFKIDFLSQQYSSAVTRPARYGEPLLERNVRDLLPLFGANKDQIESCLQERPLSSCSLSLSQRQWPEKSQVPAPYIAIVPTASFEGKRWPIELFHQFLTLCLHHPQLKKYRFVILAGKDDNFCSALNSLKEFHAERFINLQGKTSLLESVQYLKQASLCVGNDTGLPHLAESVGTSALFILGPTGEEFGFYPHLKESKVASVRLWCRPCTTNGEGRCIRSKRYCLLTITPEELLSKLLNMEKELVQ